MQQDKKREIFTGSRRVGTTEDTAWSLIEVQREWKMSAGNSSGQMGNHDPHGVEAEMSAIESAALFASTKEDPTTIVSCRKDCVDAIHGSGKTICNEHRNIREILKKNPQIKVEHRPASRFPRSPFS